MACPLARSLRCRAWAALFAVHAGDEQHASAVAAGANRTGLEENPGLAAWLAVVTASAEIDRDEFEAAVREARVAVDKSAALQGTERTAIRGRALGTLGRALMHAGKLAEAEAPLREGAEAHRPYPGAELPQSLCYVATCLRLASRIDEALSVIDEALAANTELMKTRDAARTTEHYLLMERGRTLIAMGRHDDAERALLAVAPRALPGSYPRLGAERSLVRLRVEAGADAGAREAFLRCMEAARSMLSSDRGLTLGRVAAVGIAEGILGLSLAPAELAEARALWRKAFDSAVSPDEIRNVLAMWIY
jgi:tetratricopeptide (TPR) repeat protein